MAASSISTSRRMAPTIERTLPNGMKLLIRPNRDVAVATVDIWVRTGAADEPTHISGISHFLEHMMFKGTARFKTGEIEREIENAGGVCNAGTSYDFTHYYLTLPSDRIGRGIEMLSEMISGSSLDPEELEKERLVILEEYRRKQDNPGAMLYEDVYNLLYEAGPYHMPVIGSEETIRSISREQMADYYGRQYSVDNSVLIITGDVEVDEAEAMAARAFAGFTRKLNPVLAQPLPIKISGAKRHHREKPTGGEMYWGLACAGPGASEQDKFIPLDVAQFILGQGRAAILYQEIKEKRQLAPTISCHFSQHRHESLFIVSSACEPARVDELSKAVRETLNRFANDPIPADQFNRARRLLGSALLFSLETTGGASSETGYYYTLTGGTRFLDSYLDQLDALTPEAVQSAFADMLRRYEFIEVTVGPKG